MPEERLNDLVARLVQGVRRELGITPYEIHLPYQDGPHKKVAVLPVAAEPAETLTLSDADHTILTAVSEFDGAPKASAIAKAAGQKNDAHLGRCLSALRKRGLLGGEAGTPGYPLTPAGELALANHIGQKSC